MRGPFEGIEKEWIENISYEMSIILDGTSIYGKHNIYKGKESLCETFA